LIHDAKIASPRTLLVGNETIAMLDELVPVRLKPRD
jgi:hypothetical protein